MSETILHTGQPVSINSTFTAILAGTVVSLALIILFTLLGLGIGVASLEAVGQGLGVTAALYIVLTHIISLAAGGFTAARLVSPDDSMSAMLTGTAVWALATIAVAFGGVNAGTSAISSSTNLVAQTAKTSTDAIEAIIPENIALPDISEIAGSISMADLPPELREVLQDADVTPAQLRAEVREAFRNVVSQQEMNRAQSLLTATLSNISEEPASFVDEMNNLIDQLVVGENAVFNEKDLAEAESTLEMRLGITSSQAEQLVNEVQESFNSAVETLRQTVAELQDRFLNTAKDIQGIVAAAALWLFLASVLSMLAAAGAGYLGRRQ